MPLVRLVMKDRLVLIAACREAVESAGVFQAKLVGHESDA
jgi:hypothetical protein